MLQLHTQVSYYFFNQPADMRKGFDGLYGLVKQHTSFNPLSGAVFIFINRKHNQIKLLSWDGDGFCMYYKRLEKGTYEWPATKQNEHIQLSAKQLGWLLQGVQLSSIKTRPRYQQKAA